MVNSTKKFAEKVSEILNTRLKPKEVKISPKEIMGHALLEVIPLFGGETERKKASESELKSVQTALTKKEEKEEGEEAEAENEDALKEAATTSAKKIVSEMIEEEEKNNTERKKRGFTKNFYG